MLDDDMHWPWGLPEPLQTAAAHLSPVRWSISTLAMGCVGLALSSKHRRPLSLGSATLFVFRTQSPCSTPSPSHLNSDSREQQHHENAPNVGSCIPLVFGPIYQTMYVCSLWSTFKTYHRV